MVIVSDQSKRNTDKAEANGGLGGGGGSSPQGPQIAISSEKCPDLNNGLSNGLLFFEQWVFVKG